jgi:PAS domain S-box-containing protein
MSLVWRLYALVALAVLPAIAIQGWNELSLRREREAQAHVEAQRLAQFVAGEMEQLVEGARLLLTAVASSPSLRQRDRPACTRLMQDLTQGLPQFTALALADSQGQWLCAAAEPPLQGSAIAGQPWFKAALQQSGLTILGHHQGALTKRPVLLLAQPLRTAQGAAGELLLLGLDLDWLGRYLAARELPEGGSIEIADRQGILLARLPGPAEAGDPIAQRWMLGAGAAGTFAGVGSDGVERVVGYIPPGAAPAHEFLVSVGLAKAPLMRPVDAATRRGLLLIATGLGLALLAAWGGGRLFILRPIGLLSAAAARWHKGDLGSRATLPTRGDELGRLADSMNRMAAAIQARENALRASEAGLTRDVENRKAAEAQLRQSRARLELALAAGRMGVWDWDLVSGDMLWDAAQHRIFGTDPERFVPDGNSILALVHPDDRPALRELAQEALASGRPYHKEFRIITPAGELRWLAGATAITLDDAGRPVRVSGVSQDITLRRQVEEERARALAETARERELFKALVDNLAEAIVAVFPQEGIVLRNAAWLPMHGFTSFDELPGQSTESFAHLFEVRDAHGRLIGPGSWVIRRVLGGETLRDLEVLLRRTDIEHERWLSYHGAAVKDASGTVVLAILTIRDITERKRFEASLRQRDEMLALAEDAARIGAWEVDLGSASVRGTPSFFRLHGLEPSAGPVPHEIVRAQRHPADQARVAAEFKDTASRGATSFETEYRVAHDDGWRWILGRGRVVRDDTGKPARYAGIDMDITERRLAEEQQRLLVGELDHRVKNLLAVIQSIVQQSGHQAGDVPALQESLLGRLRAMAVAHELLSSTSWRGAALADLVERTLAPHRADDPQRLRLAVDNLVLGPSIAQNLSLALHELATNAAKYGAWSVPAGQVSLSGGSGPAGELVLVWQESGGPPVAPPTRKGFGSLLLSRALGYQTGGRVDLDWRPDGLVCRIVLPLERGRAPAA